MLSVPEVLAAVRSAGQAEKFGRSDEIPFFFATNKRIYGTLI